MAHNPGTAIKIPRCKRTYRWHVQAPSFPFHMFLLLSLFSVYMFVVSLILSETNQELKTSRGNFLITNFLTPKMSFKNTVKLGNTSEWFRSSTANVKRYPVMICAAQGTPACCAIDVRMSGVPEIDNRIRISTPGNHKKTWVFV